MGIPIDLNQAMAYDVLSYACRALPPGVDHPWPDTRKLMRRGT